MKFVNTLFAFLISVAVSTLALAEELTMVWQTSGIPQPESIVFDKQRNQYYVSSVNGNPLEADGKGGIALVSGDGKLLDAEWVAGLNAPKGLALVKDTLYVADIDHLVVIDVTNQRIKNRIPANNAKFLNDVVAQNNGTVYVSDTFTSTIYQLKDEQLSVWLQDEQLKAPNGLFIKGKHLYVGAWGTNIQPDFSTDEDGLLIKVHLNSKAITEVSSAPVGQLDGVEKLSGGKWLATDWLAGELMVLDKSGDPLQVFSLGQGSADLTYHKGQGQKLILVPMMLNNEVRAYKF